MVDVRAHLLPRHLVDPHQQVRPPPDLTCLPGDPTLPLRPRFTRGLFVPGPTPGTLDPIATATLLDARHPRQWTTLWVRLMTNVLERCRAELIGFGTDEQVGQQQQQQPPPPLSPRWGAVATACRAAVECHDSRALADHTHTAACAGRHVDPVRLRAIVTAHLTSCAAAAAEAGTGTTEAVHQAMQALSCVRAWVPERWTGSPATRAGAIAATPSGAPPVVTGPGGTGEAGRHWYYPGQWWFEFQHCTPRKSPCAPPPPGASDAVSASAAAAAAAPSRPRLTVVLTTGNEYWNEDTRTLSVSWKKLPDPALWTYTTEIVPPVVAARCLLRAKQLTSCREQLPERQVGQLWHQGIHPDRAGHVVRIARAGWVMGDAYAVLKPYTKYSPVKPATKNTFA